MNILGYGQSIQIIQSHDSRIKWEYIIHRFLTKKKKEMKITNKKMCYTIYIVDDEFDIWKSWNDANVYGVCWLRFWFWLWQLYPKYSSRSFHFVSISNSSHFFICTHTFFSIMTFQYNDDNICIDFCLWEREREKQKKNFHQLNSSFNFINKKKIFKSFFKPALYILATNAFVVVVCNEKWTVKKTKIQHK